MDVMTENKVVPKLRFGEFKDDWNNHLLDDIATFLKGKGISKSELDDDGKTECIRYGELYVYYNELIDEVKSKTNLENLVLSKANDVIIPASGETQLDIATASCVLRSGIALGGDLNVIRTENNGLFLSYYLNSKKKFEIARLSQGSSVVHLYASQLKTLKLNLPILAEQQKIAAFLSAVDKKLQQLTKKKKLLEEYKKGIMQKMFSKELRFKDDNGNNYPDWEEKKLVELFDFRRGKNISENKEGKQFLLGMGSVSEQGKLITKKRTNNNNHLLSKNDLVMPERDIGMGYIIGRVAIIDEDDRYVLGANILSLSPKDDILSHFIYYQINDNIFRKKMRRIINGSAQLMITSKDVIRLQLQLPVFDEQKKIANFLSSLDSKIDLISTQIENTKVFKKGLLQQIFV